MVSPPAVRLASEKSPSIFGARKRSRACPSISADFERNVLVDDVGRGAREASPTARRPPRVSATSARSMPLASTRNSGATLERSGETTLRLPFRSPSPPIARSPVTWLSPTAKLKIVEHARAVRRRRKASPCRATGGVAERAGNLRLAGRRRTRNDAGEASPAHRRADGPSAPRCRRSPPPRPSARRASR